MPETSITPCQNTLVEQSVVLGSSHVSPPALPDHLLGYSDARLNLSELVLHNRLAG